MICSYTCILKCILTENGREIFCSNPALHSLQAPWLDQLNSMGQRCPRCSVGEPGAAGILQSENGKVLRFWGAPWSPIEHMDVELMN